LPAALLVVENGGCGDFEGLSGIFPAARKTRDGSPRLVSREVAAVLPRAASGSKKFGPWSLSSSAADTTSGTQFFSAQFAAHFRAHNVGSVGGYVCEQESHPPPSSSRTAAAGTFRDFALRWVATAFLMRFVFGPLHGIQERNTFHQTYTKQVVYSTVTKQKLEYALRKCGVASAMVSM
jgi:hypothetical protein